MLTRCLVLAAALTLGLAAVGLRAAAVHAAPPGSNQSDQATLDELLDTLRANRKALVAANLRLSDAEAARFWPVYERYQQESSAIGERQAAVIDDYSRNFRQLSNEKATKLVEDYLQIDADRVALRRAYLPEFAKVLPGRTLARFYQIENKMDAVIRFDLASTIPVLEEK